MLGQPWREVAGFSAQDLTCDSPLERSDIGASYGGSPSMFDHETETVDAEPCGFVTSRLYLPAPDADHAEPRASAGFHAGSVRSRQEAGGVENLHGDQDGVVTVRLRGCRSANDINDIR
jgi:hypothetical protein